MLQSCFLLQVGEKFPETSAIETSKGISSIPHKPLALTKGLVGKTSLVGKKTNSSLNEGCIRLSCPGMSSYTVI